MKCIQCGDAMKRETLIGKCDKCRTMKCANKACGQMFYQKQIITQYCQACVRNKKSAKRRAGESLYV